MLPSYFDYIFVHLRQKARLRPELNPKFMSTLGPNPIRKARPDLQFCAESHQYGAIAIPDKNDEIEAAGQLSCQQVNSKMAKEPKILKFYLNEITEGDPLGSKLI